MTTSENSEPEDTAISVLIVDDEPLIRSGIRAILGSDPDMSVVGEASDGREAVSGVLRFRPQVVLLDIRMPNLDGLDAIPEILRAWPETKIVMLTTFGEDAYIAGALERGAVGFLLKASDPRELQDAVRAVAAGAAYLSPRVAQRVIDRFRSGPSPDAEARSRIDELSERERDVLALLGAGKANSEVARELFLTEGTVKGYVSAILAKLGAANRVQAAILAHRAGIIADGPPS
ncbi:MULTISPECIES: response regulator [Brevibacterium]|uniref:DNA-binding response regulator, NarL/FixJ family, contains REC and HTH domains n=2 Tax=Brevibacterium TaxID=1696 RepID=A0A1H1V6K9_BRESA|nr:response regulator transcription factor [Brevibacterium sandarakinum]SDS80335.1 DNA-binding response regulator, NarL/FixJ family, contains REC and HTH domains [Brevibacterium sandarakinum]